MRTMGLDVGSKTIGVAVSDSLGLTAQGITTIYRRNSKEDVNAVKELAQKYEVELLVLGLPRNMNGTYGPQVEMVKSFARKLERELRLPVCFFDERLTTVAADKALMEADLTRKRRREAVNRVAASLILQGFLDRQG